MNSDKLLPVGSVVLLHNAEKELMVVGVLPVNDGQRYDYISVLHPEGYLSEKHFYMFNHSDIAQIKFIGYVNAAHQAFRSGLAALLDGGNKKENVDQNDTADSE